MRVCAVAGEPSAPASAAAPAVRKRRRSITAASSPRGEAKPFCGLLRIAEEQCGVYGGIRTLQRRVDAAAEIVAGDTGDAQRHRSAPYLQAGETVEVVVVERATGVKRQIGTGDATHHVRADVEIMRHRRVADRVSVTAITGRTPINLGLRVRPAAAVARRRLQPVTQVALGNAGEQA